MKTVNTNDGSQTLHNDEYDETYHSTSGALDEALRKFVEPCGVTDGMTILDIGFGLGYNVGMALHHARDLKIISLEKEIVDLSELAVPSWFEKTYSKVKKCSVEGTYSDSECRIEILEGDATKTILSLPCEEQFNCVFLDAFSPKKNPELWTVSFFSEIFKRMKKGAVLATYSCAGQVRRNLKEVGFCVTDGPCVGRRSPSTIAVKE